MEYVNNLDHNSNDVKQGFVFRFETTKRVEQLMFII